MDAVAAAGLRRGDDGVDVEIAAHRIAARRADLADGRSRCRFPGRGDDGVDVEIAAHRVAADPICCAVPASLVCSDSESAGVKTATKSTPSEDAARAIRMAISPRLAIRTRLNISSLHRFLFLGPRAARLLSR